MDTFLDIGESTQSVVDWPERPESVYRHVVNPVGLARLKRRGVRPRGHAAVSFSDADGRAWYREHDGALIDQTRTRYQRFSGYLYFLQQLPSLWVQDWRDHRDGIPDDEDPRDNMTAEKRQRTAADIAYWRATRDVRVIPSESSPSPGRLADNGDVVKARRRTLR